MYKNLLSAALLLMCLFPAKSQTILNSDFSASVTDPRFNIFSFYYWAGSTQKATDYFPNSGDAAKLEVRNVQTQQCIAYGYVKGKYGCTGYGIVTTLKNENINQNIFNITNIPLELVGDYSFTSNNAANVGGIIVSGNYSGKSFIDTLKLSNNATSETGKIKLTLKPFTGPAIGNLNSLNIQLNSCFNCGTDGLKTTTLIVDNLEFTNPTLGIESEIENLKLIFPNPAKDKIFSEYPIEIYSLAGQLLVSGNKTIDISSLHSGLYIVKSANGFARLIKE